MGSLKLIVAQGRSSQTQNEGSRSTARADGDVRAQQKQRSLDKIITSYS